MHLYDLQSYCFCNKWQKQEQALHTFGNGIILGGVLFFFLGPLGYRYFNNFGFLPGLGLVGFTVVGLMTGGVKFTDSSVLDESIPFSGDPFLKKKKKRMPFQVYSSKDFQSETI